MAAALVRSQDIDETALVLCLDYVLRYGTASCTVPFVFSCFEPGSCVLVG